MIQANLNSVGKYIFLLFMLFLSTLNAFDAVIQLQVCILIHGFGGTIREKAENPKSKLDMIVSYSHVWISKKVNAKSESNCV